MGARLQVGDTVAGIDPAALHDFRNSLVEQRKTSQEPTKLEAARSMLADMRGEYERDLQYDLLLAVVQYASRFTP